MNFKKHNGFSMVEAMVAALVLSISVLGAFATISSQKAPAAQSDQRVLAALAAKKFLEDLRGKVNATDYQNNTGELSTNVHPPVVVGAYTFTYTVTAVGNARKVDLTVSW
jgi:Tfp pilus assembly protein PilV